MIELKPYRGTEVPDPSISKSKERLAGRTLTSWDAYDQSWQGSFTWMVAIFALLLGAGAIFLGGLTIIVLGTAYFFQSFITRISIVVNVVLCCLSLLGTLGLEFLWISRVGPWIYKVFKTFWRRAFFHQAEQPNLLISDEHLHRGAAFEIIFRQPVRSDTIMDYSLIEVVSRETITYTQPLKHHPTLKHHPDQLAYFTESYDVTLKRDQVFDGAIPPNRVYEHHFKWMLPSNIMHSFSLADNSLTWIIRITIQFKNFIPLSEVYAFQVTPEIHTL